MSSNRIKNNPFLKEKTAVLLVWRLLIIIFLFVLLTLGSGRLLDSQAEHAVEQLYVRDQQGVIEGLQPIVLANRSKRALVLLHGFLDSPAVYSDIVDNIKNRLHVDIYVPLLPFHARNLEAASQFDNQEIINYVKQYINDLSKKYQTLTIVGLSYGGLILVDLIRTNELPKNVNLILYAPAVFITTNTLVGRLKAEAYGYWRKYCDYAFLGCRFPSYESADESARPMFDKERTLRHSVMPAILQLYKLDLENRKEFDHINRPYNLIIAADDNRVDFAKQKAACDANRKYCRLYAFASGKHLIHWGENRDAFEELLIRLSRY